MSHLPPSPASRAGGTAPWRRAAGAVLLALAAGCSSFSLHLLNRDRPDARTEPEAAARPAAPARYSFRIAPYVFVSDFPVDSNQPLFRELADLRNQVSRELQLPVGTAPVQVHLFETHERYEAFIKSRYPNLPTRRAFFVALPRPMGGGEDLLVYTWWGPRIGQDLRHELTHAFLHSVLRGVPLWLDEGLAEYFELPPAVGGVNADHVDHLSNDGGGPYRPDLARLERMTEVDEMKRPEYREAWAWVHLMLHSTPQARAVLVAYLQQLREKGNVGPLRPKLSAVFANPEDELTRHVARLAAAGRPQGSAAAR
jgi:hypothetical protein